jgi:hypothetical protein
MHRFVTLDCAVGVGQIVRQLHFVAGLFQIASGGPDTFG